MSEAAIKIKRFERRVMWRERLISLQDNLSIALLASGVLSGAIIIYAKMRAANAPSWLIAAALFSLILAALFVRWYLTRSTERRAAFRIDQSLQMEDRLTTARSIIERGGPEREIESALIDDVAERLEGASVSRIAPYRFAPRHALSFVGLIAIVVAVLIPQKALPGGEELIAEQADVREAGEMLEQSAQDVIRELPPEVETARLATEQAELGRALRRSSDTRAEALKKISELEGRIRQRHDYLADTRADEIVNLAEKRLRDALSAATKSQDNKKTQAQSGSSESSGTDSTESQANELEEAKGADDSREIQPRSAKESDNVNRAKPIVEEKDQKSIDKSSEQSNAKSKSEQSGSVTPNTNQNRSNSEGATGENSSRQQSDQSGKEGQSAGDQKSSQQSSQSNTASDITATSGKQEDQQSGQVNDSTASQPGDADKPQEKSDLQSGLSGMMAEQAASVVPKLSEQLLKSAEQFRLDQLKPEDIRRLREAAEQLARDLAPIAESEEFRKMVEQFASRVNPEQLEQMARELMKREDVRRELQAAARLLAENRQIKEIASGLAQQQGRENRQSADEGLRSSQRQAGNQSSGRSGQGRQSDKNLFGLSASQPLSTKGRDARLSGNMQKRQGGEYLFLQSKPGAGAARAPYSSAYPRYRREAERSVERSQVPPHLRSLVRNYFDVINPDAGKQR